MLATEQYGDRFAGSTLYYQFFPTITALSACGFGLPTGHLEFLEIGYTVTTFTGGTAPTLYPEFYYCESSSNNISVSSTSKGTADFSFSANAVSAGQTYIKKYDQDEFVLKPTVAADKINNYISSIFDKVTDVRFFNVRLVLTGSPTSANNTSFWCRVRPFSDSLKSR